MEPVPESLLPLYGDLFPAMRQQRGRRLFEGGLAGIVDIDFDTNEIHGEVEDPSGRRQRLHEVSLLPEPDDLEVSCTCNGPMFCEHAFAILLAIDAMRTQALAAMRKDRAPTHPAPAPSRTQPPQPTHRDTVARTPWRSRIEEIAAAMQDAAPDAQELAAATKVEPITFVVDVEQTREARALVLVAMEPALLDGKPALRARPQGARTPALAAADRQALSLLAAVDSGIFPAVGSYTVAAEYLPAILPLLCSGGRLHQVSTLRSPDSGPLTGLTFDTGAPFRLSTAAQRTPSSTTIHGALHRGSETLLPSAVLALLDGGFALLHDRIVPVDIGTALPLARTLLEHGPLEAPAAEQDALLQATVALTLADETVTPPVPTRVAAAPVPVLVAHLARPMSKHVMAELQFDYSGRVAGFDDGHRVLSVDADGCMLLRDLAAESALLETFDDTHGRGLEHSHMAGCYLLQKRTVLAELTALVAAGVRVLADGKPMLPSTGLRVSVASGIDWFDVHGEVTFADGTSLSLASALLSARRGERMVALGDGRTGVLPDELLQRWASVLELGERQDDGVRLQRGQALLLDALLASRDPGDVDADPDFQALRRRLADFRGITPRPAPEGFAGTLRDYQRTGLAWLHFLRELGLGGCLADDMGLGKTVQVLALLIEVHRARRGPPSLLVVPRSLIDNWAREAARFTPTLRVLDFGTPDRWDRAGAAAFSEHDLILTTYGTLRSDVARFEAEKITFEYAILDEAQAVENAQSLTSKAVRLVRARHRLALTGTPVQNHIGELWALFEFLSPGMLGKSKTFQTLLANGRGGNGAKLDVDLLRKALAPFLLRRTKEQVLTELPQKQEHTIHCELGTAQRRIYDALRDHYRHVLLQGGSKLANQERFVALEALLRLRQAACHPQLVDGSSALASAKLETMLPMLKEIAETGHKALVFSQFTEFLAIVRGELDAAGIIYEYLDGKTRNRQTHVDRFQQDPDCRVFLISLKAGGFGLNLTAADYVFLLDPWWNPAAEAQAIDRSHRMGQTQRVVAYRLVAKDTVEEKVLQLQAEKRALADAVLGGDSSLLAGMTREDLAQILG